MELRCPGNRLFGHLDEGVLEVKCKSKCCGAESGTVVLHRINLSNGELIKTLRFKEPSGAKER